MYALLITAALAIVPVNDGTLHDRVDVLELSHFYDEYGRLVFDQLIFWDFESYQLPLPIGGTGCRYQVRAWRLVKDVSQLPRRDHERGGWTVRWQDGDVIRDVFAKDYRETWLQYDVELEERNVLPKDSRRKLKGER